MDEDIGATTTHGSAGAGPEVAVQVSAQLVHLKYR
jgi:hypothetical protein